MGSRLTRPGSGADRWFEIKSQVHHKLLNSLTAEQLKDLNKDSVRGQIGLVVEKLIMDERLPITLAEREKLIEEILDEVFGLGPLETAAEGSLHQRHHGQRLRQRLHRARRAAWWKPTSVSRTRPTCA